MNLLIPKTFIQIHYHNRAGGVARVMERYSEVFNRTSRSNDIKSFVICNNYLKIIPSHFKVISITECDYHRFRTENAFSLLQQKLFRKLLDLLSNKDLPKPVCVVAHNLSLGKNAALSAAFSDLVNLFKSDNEVRFYSVIHDMAEEGRTNLFSHISYLEHLGIPVWDYLYPGGNLEYVVLNKRNCNLFKNAEFPVTLLPNPMEAVGKSYNMSRPEQLKIGAALVKLSNMDNTSFNPSSETVLYPVRIISRKNVLEAVIQVCIIRKSNLLLGSAGTSRHDKKLFNNILLLSQRYNLPVILDVERIREYLTEKLIKGKNILELLYRYSDWCITSSIAEGFGYALYEPWMYFKEVTGRLPHGISKTEIINLNHLYNAFYIPVSWISVEELLNQYCLEIMRAFGKTILPPDANEAKKHFQKTLIHNSAIDFGILSQKMQFEVIRKLIKDNGIMRVELEKLNDKKSKRGKDAVLIRKNRKAIIDNLTGRAYDKRFMECFYALKPIKKKVRSKNSPFIQYLSSVKEFRLLMSNS